jgi:hypothetical protein
MRRIVVIRIALARFVTILYTAWSHGFAMRYLTSAHFYFCNDGRKGSMQGHEGCVRGVWQCHSGPVMAYSFSWPHPYGLMAGKLW